MSINIIFITLCIFFFCVTPSFGKWGFTKAVFRFGAKNHDEEDRGPRYDPPEQISYGSEYYPAYKSGVVPDYVYKGLDPKHKFNNLLNGLALYNLGRMRAKKMDFGYSNKLGETCMLDIREANEEYMIRIDCQLISSFIKEEENNKNLHKFVPLKNATRVVPVDEMGPPIEVKPGMTCAMIRDNLILKNEECGLLQAYAEQSFSYGSPWWVYLIAVVGVIIIITLKCKFC